jgi:signal transduction histidine kinase
MGSSYLIKMNSPHTLIGNNPQNSQSMQESYFVMIEEDRSGVIWTGTIMQGLEKSVRQKQLFKSYKNTLNPSQVKSITGDSSSNIWVGTMNGLDKLELSTGKYTHYENENNNPNSLSNNQVISLLIDNSGTLWVGTYNGLNKFDVYKNKFTQYHHSDSDTNSIADNYIERLFEDSYGEFWIGTGYGGLDKFDRNNNIFIHHRNDPNDSGSFGSTNVRAIYEDKNRTMWFGSGIVYCGISSFDRINKSFTTFYNAQSIRGVTDIYNDSKNRFWVTSVWTGLNLFDRKTGTANTYNINSALQSNCVYKILEDNSGKLWLSTHHGLSCFDPETEESRNYHIEDGLSVTEFNFRAAYKNKEGTMYFGGEGGVISFHPDSIIINTQKPNIVLTDFKLFNQSVLPSEGSPLKKNINVADKIELRYYDNSFSFEFAALDYRNPNRNQYAYVMEGFDKNWINSGNVRTVSYTNLDPGEYTFRVKGSNNDGVWNEEGASVKVIITPPWWKTWWFRGSGMVLIIGLLGYVRQRKLSKIKNELVRQSEFTKQLINTQEAERKRIAGELHDTLGQDLLIIKNKALHGLKNPLKNPELIADISEISSTSLQEVREISYNLASLSARAAWSDKSH